MSSSTSSGAGGETARQPAPLLDGVRAGCAAVAARATHVRVRADRLAAYAAQLPLAAIARPELDRRHHYLGPPEPTLAYFLTLDTVNFGSGYFPHLQKPAGLSGYYTVASALKARFERDGPLGAEELRRITPAACAAIFGQDLADPARAEIMALFARALNELGELLAARYGGALAGLIAAADGSAERLVELLAALRFYQDVEPYGELRIPFYKRAQLAAADLALAFRGQGYGFFRDLDRLTIFADNLVPHVLRLDGILDYDAALLARIDAGERIPAGSPEEVEIRAGAVHAVELLAARLRAAGTPLSPHELDYFLWTRGQGPRYKAVPRHRTRTVFY